MARAVVAPLTRLVAEQQRQLIDQVETIGTLRSERDVARAEVDMLKAAQTKQEGQEAPEAPDLTLRPALPSWHCCGATGP